MREWWSWEAGWSVPRYSLRLEKGFGSWAREYRPLYDPFEAGLGRFVCLDKAFIGRDALSLK